MGTHPIIHYAEYPHTVEAIKSSLLKIFTKSVLACDIETNSLDLARAKLVSISFAWSIHEGIAFCVSRDQTTNHRDDIKVLLKEFFTHYEGEFIYHNGSFDITILIRELFEDQLEGLQAMTRNVHDTKLIAYLCSNNTSINNLSLKHLARVFAGDYAVDIKNINNVETPDLLQYNLIDSLSTIYLFDRDYSQLTNNNQIEVYNNIFIPSLKNIIHMQLNGLPMDIEHIQKTKEELLAIQNQHLATLRNSKIIKDYEWQLQRKAFIEKNNQLKLKVKPLDDFKTQFNPNSGPQISGLLYDFLELEVLNYTEKGNPATDKETLEGLLKLLEKNT